MQRQEDRDAALAWVLLMGVVAGMVTAILGVVINNFVTAFIVTSVLGAAVLVFLWARRCS